MEKNKREIDKKIKVNKGLLSLTIILLFILVLLVIGVTYQIYLYAGDPNSEKSLINRIIGREDDTHTRYDDGGSSSDSGSRKNNIVDYIFGTDTKNSDSEKSSDGQKEKEEEESGSITMIYKEGTNKIAIEDAVPITDAAGKLLDHNNEVMDFTVSVNIGRKAKIAYQVVAEKMATSTLDNEYARIYLERGIDNNNYEEVLAPTSYSGISADNSYGAKKGMMVLDEVTTDKTITNYYRLRMWLSYDYPMDEVSRVFKLRVNVYGKEVN